MRFLQCPMARKGAGLFLGVKCKEGNMATALDVAQYILDKRGPLPAMKLQKIVYYAQAWSLVWDEKPLFPNVIEAWANGPVIPDLYTAHRGQFEVSAIPGGDASTLTVVQRESIDAVIEGYADRSSQWLSDLTHSERPWHEARRGLPPGEPATKEISTADLAEYYGGL